METGSKNKMIENKNLGVGWMRLAVCGFCNASGILAIVFRRMPLRFHAPASPSALYVW